MIETNFIEYQLDFKFDAGTSRGVMIHHKVIFLILEDKNSNLKGIGECAPLPGLSVEDINNVQSFLKKFNQDLSGIYALTDLESISGFVNKIVPESLPSVRFGFETAILDLKSGGQKEIFSGEFFNGVKRIPINGLIWMGDKEFMLNQIKTKIDQGFDCLKMKIGAIDFNTELDILNFIRANFSEKDLTIRVDANGAFSLNEAYEKLGKLSKFKLHSIEQPIKQGNYLEMKGLCAESPVPIALDEELIGVPLGESEGLLNEIKPQYIILKPTLIGGLGASDKWISTAEKLGIEWWMTSALESNIGLNSIAQYTGYKNVSLPQGLGTGQLYHNNVNSPLTIENGEIFYDKSKSWDDSIF
ncbi:o-succinylbenzoate synthase [Marinigracilibium pacificum]|uniref:o-succinylbenzoate synthase n=1 Tax=Marinigracilibium pacificum TaxID=2729599 RepID=A0A848J3H1_9BACT|nr:o-succinylbenzoate synthase [Marinigracilibium pacificum]NMM50055.1 o-succinylbenzoate synthase [Marinigracilibium pacificum]